MNCLCCGKPLNPPYPENGWHDRCIKRFFGTRSLPKIDLNAEELQQLVIRTVSKGYTVPGVQKKMSLHLTKVSSDGPRLTLVDYPTGYILKPSVEEYPHLPEAEQMTMCMADIIGIPTVPHALIRLNGEFAYICRRIDRAEDAAGVTSALAMEDFCQLDHRLTQDKYRGSYERCAKIIDRYSARAPLDLTELYIRLLFCFLTGNSDMHLKNFSLIETAPQSGRYVLSAAYDLLPVNIILPEDIEEFALTVNGKKQHLRRKDFLIFAQSIGIPDKTADAMCRRILAAVPRLLECCDASLLPEEMRQRLRALMLDRASVLTA